MFSELVQAAFLLIKKTGQKVNHSIKTISRMFQRNNFQETAINSANNDKMKTMQCNSWGLSNKLSELLVF